MMKYFILLLTGLSVACVAPAQNIMPENDFVSINNGTPVVEVAHTNRLLSRVCFDVNMMSGTLNQQISYADQIKNYSNPLNTRISGLKFSKGASNSIDAEVGYYFDIAGRYGVGTGLMYMRQSGNLTMDDFHIEYKSTDNFNNVFRQSLTSNGQIKEKLVMNNFSIPLLFKYKLKITEMIGFNADAGFLFSLSEQVHYKTNASFDYEAIYDYTGVQGNLVPVYDYSSTPSSGDLLITKSQYLSANNASGLQNYFKGYASQGYTVGLGVKPNVNKGAVSYTRGTVGIMLRPSLNIVLSHAISVNAGVYYVYQRFGHNVPSDYRITNKLGEYNPLVNSISKATDNSYGITFGGSYSFRRIHHASVILPAEDTSSIHEEEDNNMDNEEAPKGERKFSWNKDSQNIGLPAGNEPEQATREPLLMDIIKQ